MGCSPRLAVRLGAVVVAAAAGVTLLPAAAHAGGPGVWTTLSQNPAAGGHPRMSLLDEPTVARFGDELQVAWRDDAADGSQSLRARAVGADGRALTAPVTVVAGWRGLLENPRLIDVGGRRTLVFSGRRGTGDPFSTGAAYTASSPDGRGWGLVPGALSTSDVYAGYGFDAVDVGGVPLWVGNTGTTGVRWHRGPAGASAEGVLPLADCCGSDAAVARDAVTGEVWTAFFATSDRSDVAGIHVARLLPTVAAGPRAPGSVTSYLGGLVARTPDQRVAMAARSGGGVWIAYAQGYPTVTGIRLYEVRSRRSLVVPGSAGARDISLAAAPGGRLWVTWVDAAARSLRAVRSNAAVTRFGELRVIPPRPVRRRSGRPRARAAAAGWTSWRRPSAPAVVRSTCSTSRCCPP